MLNCPHCRRGKLIAFSKPLPERIKESIYTTYDNEFDLGILYPLSNRFPSTMLVKNTDIVEGFMNRRERNNKFKDSFPRWIQYRRILNAIPKST